MQLYLAIISTYLSVSLTIFFIILWKKGKINENIKIDNIKWKEEIRNNFKKIINNHNNK